MTKLVIAWKEASGSHGARPIVPQQITDHATASHLAVELQQRQSMCNMQCQQQMHADMLSDPQTIMSLYDIHGAEKSAATDALDQIMTERAMSALDNDGVLDKPIDVMLQNVNITTGPADVEVLHIVCPPGTSARSKISP